jgi:hypothetical protein
MSTGVDRDCVYKRHPKDIVYEKEVRNILPFASSNILELSFIPIIIGFAGNLYPVVRIIKVDPNTNKEIHFHIYSIDDFNEFKKTHEIIIKDDRYYSKGELYDEIGLKDFFNENFNKLNSLFIKYKSPIFTIEKELHETEIHLNHKLKDFDFVRVKDPFTAFQEIYMFIAGVLGNPEKEIITITDKVKAQQHGHDGKYSFKKMPTKNIKRKK